jgi:3-phenylpropionate/trans-cinnamate dioxygenase ferredoxin subunit
VAEWVRVADVEDCGSEGCVHKTVGGSEQIVLVRTGGEFFALEDRCSHEDYPLSDGEMENGQLECVYHGARFDVRTGKPTRLPAVRPVRTFPVEIRDGGVFVLVE